MLSPDFTTCVRGSATLTCGTGVLVTVRMGWIGPGEGGFAWTVSKGSMGAWTGVGFETGNLAGGTGAGVTATAGGDGVGSGWL